jgi:DNA-directed RNA polymerase subunit alpha
MSKTVTERLREIASELQEIARSLQEESLTWTALPDEEIKRVPVHQLEISVRTEHALTNAGINTVGDILKYSSRELMKLPNFGTRAMMEVKDVLAPHGLYLKGDMK